MLSKRLAITRRSISAAAALTALCFAMSGTSGRAYEPQTTTPHADGIIAILIGAVGPNDDRRDHAPLTAPQDN